LDFFYLHPAHLTYGREVYLWQVDLAT
jgi:hypothetical protein